MESNDSPEISDRGETSNISGLPSGGEIGSELVENLDLTKICRREPRVANKRTTESADVQ